jgi:hypothetical protein
MFDLLLKGWLVGVGIFSVYAIEKYYRKKELIQLQEKLIRIINNLENENEEMTEKNVKLIEGCREHYQKIDEYLKQNNLK